MTLGRALIELNRLDDAFTELTFVLDTAPGDLAAIRALAEIYQRRGLMSEALVHYRRALQLAQHDADLSRTVETIEQSVEPKPPLAPSPAMIEDLFDFDSLLAQLETARAAARRRRPSCRSAAGREPARYRSAAERRCVRRHGAATARA